jgi:LysR family transcriptional regulator, benzoate and cis,cis-muconate-responsive activator of ben and cat genes
MYDVISISLRYKGHVMELRHLRYFVVLAEERNFGRAARRLRLAQPPLSQQIQRLERELGVTLFDRSKRPVQLTSAGLLLLEQARELLARAEQTVHTMAGASRGEIGQLTVGCVPSAFYDIAPAVLRAYHERYPRVRLIVHERDTTPLVAELQAGQLDVGFLRATPRAAGLEVTPVYHEPVVAVLPVTHRLAGERAIALADLADDQFIMFPRQYAPENFDLLTSACLAAGFSPHMVLERGAHHTQVGYVACGVGVALVPWSMRVLRLPGVVYKRLTPPAPSMSTAIAWSAARDSGPRDQLMAVARELTGHPDVASGHHSAEPVMDDPAPGDGG